MRCAYKSRYLILYATCIQKRISTAHGLRLLAVSGEVDLIIAVEATEEGL
jgi:hypothetical protein